MFTISKAHSSIIKVLSVFIKDYALAPLPVPAMTPLEVERFNKNKVYTFYYYTFPILFIVFLSSVCGNTKDILSAVAACGSRKRQTTPISVWATFL